MSTDDSLKRSEKMDKLFADLDSMEDDGTVFSSSKKIEKLINTVIEIYGPLVEHTDPEKARANKPENGYASIARDMNSLADSFDRFWKVISDFETRLNVGKMFNPSLETDTGIHLDLDKLVRALQESAKSLRQDARTLEKL